MMRAVAVLFATLGLVACGGVDDDPSMFETTARPVAQRCCIDKAESYAGNCSTHFGGSTECWGGSQDDGSYEMQCTCSNGGSVVAQATTKCDPCTPAVAVYQSNLCEASSS